MWRLIFPLWLLDDFTLIGLKLSYGHVVYFDPVHLLLFPFNSLPGIPNTSPFQLYGQPSSLSLVPLHPVSAANMLVWGASKDNWLSPPHLSINASGSSASRALWVTLFHAYWNPEIKQACEFWTTTAMSCPESLYNALPPLPALTFFLLPLSFSTGMWGHWCLCPI